METNKQPPSDAQAIVDAGRLSAEAGLRIAKVDIFGHELPVFVPADGRSASLLTEVISYGLSLNPRPRRLKGTATHEELDSFIKHVNRQKQPESVIFACTQNCTLTAIINYHSAAVQPKVSTVLDPDKNMIAMAEFVPEQPAWADHRIGYNAPLSAEWERWTENAGKPLTPEQFAELVEFNSSDLTAGKPGEDFPKPADLVSTARNLKIEKRVFTRRVSDPATGNMHLEHKQDDVEGSTKVPAKFLLGVPVFEAGEPYALECWLRIKTQEGGRILISYEIPDLDRVKREAFKQVRDKAKAGTGLELFAGMPE